MEPDYHSVRTGRFEFKTDPESGHIVGPDECHYADEREAMYYGQLELCGCGNPLAVHQFLCACLRLFDRDAVGWSEESGVKGITKVVKADPEIAAEFIGHFLDQRDLLEHGGSVYGSWLTERGKQLLEVGPMAESD